MICPYCGSPKQEIRVIDTRYTYDKVRRRRECQICEQRWSTVEIRIGDDERTDEKEVLLVPKGTRDLLTR